MHKGLSFSVLCCPVHVEALRRAEPSGKNSAIISQVILNRKLVKAEHTEHTGCGVSTAMMFGIVVFCVATPCSLVGGCQRFREHTALIFGVEHLNVGNIGSHLQDYPVSHHRSSQPEHV